MVKGSRGGGDHLQGLLDGAVVLALVHLIHLVRVTAKQVTISNEDGGLVAKALETLFAVSDCCKKLFPITYDGPSLALLPASSSDCLVSELAWPLPLYP